MPNNKYSKVTQINWFFSLITSFVWLVSSLFLSADTLVINKAMSASTIAEVHIEEGSIQLELEIGSDDMMAFHSILPDGLMKELKADVPLLEKRLPDFFESGISFKTSNGESLTGAITESKLKRRIVRDAITGDPLTESTEESVLAITIVYPLAEHPAELVISSPKEVKGLRPANIGFKLYHDGVAVNDFIHLNGDLKLLLDWDDSWYSKFERRTYWRQFRAPVNTFLYVENYETRVEIVARVRDLANWAGVDVGSAKAFDQAKKQELLGLLGGFLANKINLKIDEKPSEVTLERMHFLRRTLRSSTVIPEEESVNAQSAMIGAIFVCPTPSLPQNAKLEWTLFSEKHPEVNAAATDEAGPMPAILNSTDNVLEWQNFLTNPTVPKLVDVDLPVTTEKWRLPVLSIALGLSGVVLLFVKWVPRNLRIASCCGLFVLSFTTKSVALAEVESPFPVQAKLEPDELTANFSKLLHNIYVSFEFQGEEAIYDKLARSVDGDLLSQVYLETRESLVLENQGGAEVKVRDVVVLKADQVKVTEDGAIIANCLWSVTGSVGHWGHIHQRTNQYEAKVTLQVVDGEWKIVELDILNEERVL